MAEEWKLQVSYKTPNGDMINVRANTADELSILLEGVGDYSTQIASVGKLVVGASNAAPLSTPTSTTSTKQVPSSIMTQENPASGGVEETIQDRYGNMWVYNKVGAPTCVRGPMILKSGVSQAGKAYKCWSDPASGPRWSGEKIPKEQHAPIVWA
jgi:hypothetical protein